MSIVLPNSTGTLSETDLEILLSWAYRAGCPAPYTRKELYLLMKLEEAQAKMRMQGDEDNDGQR